MPESPGAENHDKEKEHRDSKKGRGVCVSVCVLFNGVKQKHKHVDKTKK